MSERDLGRFVMSAEYSNGQKICVEVSAETNLSDMLDAVETYLIAIGFDRESVVKVIGAP